ncbi:MAG: DUF1217 domain-containing protein [Paracoccaceae bacterium]
MNFQPVLPFAGLSGWSFLERTRERQQEAFNSSTTIERDTEYFRENISGITSAADLVADRRLLSVALGAFGLDDDINNKYFIRKVLEDGTLETDALANRLADKRYLALSKAFGFGDFSVSNTQLSDFPDKIISAFQNRQFEISIGEQNSDMRLALGVQRDLDGILAKDTTENGLWFSIMGTPTLRRVFETALGLPSSLVVVSLDQQLKVFKDRAEQIFGSSELSQFSDPENREKLTRLFLIRSDATTQFSGTSPGAAAVTLLQNAGYGTSLI